MRILNVPKSSAVRFLGRNGAHTRGVLVFQLVLFEQALHASGWTGTLWLTSACEGTHSKGSLHPWGWAVDFDLVPDPVTNEEWDRLLTICRTVLGAEFQLIFEGGSRSHAHLELDP